MGYSREELFRRAKEQRKVEKQKKESSSYTGGDYENIVYTALSSQTDGKVVRIFGNPIVVRENPTDPKLSYISMIVGDNGKKFRCIWPGKEENSSWFLWKVFDTVAAFTWSKEKDDKGYSKKIYTHEKSHPEYLKRVLKNGLDHKFESGWYPLRFVNLNVIDRQDPEFHKENKHSKLISKKAAEIGDTGNFWYEPGIPLGAYNTIWDDVLEYAGDWEGYDIILRKLDDNPWYKAFHGEDDFKKLSEIEREAVISGPMTEEEKAYELYDLDRIFKVTSYSKIMNRLGDFIKKVDIDFKKSFYSELEALVEKEKAEREANQESDDSDVDEPSEATQEAEEIEEKEEKPIEVPKKLSSIREVATPATREAKKKIDWDALADGSFNGKEYLGVPKMTEDEKSMVIKVKDDGSFEYVKEFNGEKVQILQNVTNQFDSPSTFHVDPLSGEEF